MAVPDGDLVVGLDSSTQSVKAIAWSANGQPMGEGRAPLEISQPQPRHAEQDAESWWTGTCAALRELTSAIDPARIKALAISNQRETMVLTDAAGTPLAPATLWLDRRAYQMPAALAESFGGERLHRLTGKPIDVIPCLYRLAYFRRTRPELIDAAVRILDVHGFLTWRLTGVPSASWTSADAFGLFELEGKRWASELLDHIGVPMDKLPAAHRPGSAVGTVQARAAAATGLPAGTPVFAAGGDGHCAGLGVDAIRPGTAYLNLGTAVVGGVWSPTPDVSRYWRTLTGPTGEGYLLESCQRAGAFFVNWLIDTFAGGRVDPGVFGRMEHAAAALPVGSDGVTVCSYLVGCMDPHWDEDARAAFMGLGPEHGPAHVYRAGLEAITLEFARALGQARETGLPVERIVAIGGGASSPAWVKMVADSTGIPVARGLSNEASALGAGISAAVGLGWYDGFADAAAAMTRTAEQTDPDPGAAPAWAALSRRQAAVYHADRAMRAALAGDPAPG